MISVDIPGHPHIRLDHLVLDYNGTLAVDGVLEPGVADALNRLAGELTVHVVTADTFGKAKTGLDGVECRLSILPPGAHDAAKLDYVHRLGAGSTAAIGNGRNDRLMLRAAALGIAVILREGAARETMAAADIVCTGILPALELLLSPLRLTATLRA
ncbi:MAG: HAD family hydrolase [Desulfobacterales bacterium]